MLSFDETIAYVLEDERLALARRGLVAAPAELEDEVDSSRRGMPSLPVAGIDGLRVVRASSTAPGRSSARRKPAR